VNKYFNDLSMKCLIQIQWMAKRAAFLRARWNEALGVAIISSVCTCLFQNS